MKKTTRLIALIIFLSGAIHAQESEKQIDNYVIKRLIICNTNDEILVVKYNDTWNIPALRFNTTETYNEALIKLANDMGVVIETPKIAGIFSFTYDYMSQAALRMFYVTSYKSGKPIVKKGWDDVKWVSKTAYQKLKNQDVYSLMASKIIEDVSIVWGGAFFLYKEDEKVKYKITQEFYNLRS